MLEVRETRWRGTQRESVVGVSYWIVEDPRLTADDLMGIVTRAAGGPYICIRCYSRGDLPNRCQHILAVMRFRNEEEVV